MRKLNPLAEKRAANAEHAAKFPQRSKRARRQARRARVLVRELRWLRAVGLEPDEHTQKLMKKGRRR